MIIIKILGWGLWIYAAFSVLVVIGILLIVAIAWFWGHIRRCMYYLRTGKRER
jgi:hypothetical protein